MNSVFFRLITTKKHLFIFGCWLLSENLAFARKIMVLPESGSCSPPPFSPLARTLTDNIVRTHHVEENVNRYILELFDCRHDTENKTHQHDDKPAAYQHCVINKHLYLVFIQWSITRTFWLVMQREDIKRRRKNNADKVKCTT